MFFAPVGVVCSNPPRIRCRVEEVTWDVYGVYDCELRFCSGLSGGREGWGWQGKGGFVERQEGLDLRSIVRYGVLYSVAGEARWRSYKSRSIRRL